jgi:DNA-binding GntR family transcriptional regulator
MSENRAEAELVSEIFKLYYQPSGEFLALKEHEGIAGAIIEGDSVRAELLMRAHIESSRDRFAPVMSALKHGKKGSNLG